MQGNIREYFDLDNGLILMFSGAFFFRAFRVRYRTTKLKRKGGENHDLEN